MNALLSQRGRFARIARPLATRRKKGRSDIGRSDAPSPRILRAGSLVGAIVLLGVMGCSSGPGRIDPPRLDPETVGAEALELCDTNGDGFLIAEELDACPGLRAALKTVDQDDDGKMTADEIAQRVRSWVDSGTGSLPASCFVRLNGRPVDQAEIVFEPEPFLVGVVSTARGQTDPTGSAELSCEGVPFGVQVGFYRVRISKLKGSDETIPANYNAETTLGAEVSSQSPGILMGRYQFDLKN